MIQTKLLMSIKISQYIYKNTRRWKQNIHVFYLKRGLELEVVHFNRL